MSSSASSPQVMRRVNATRVLECMWGLGPATASELMEATGLTRATVLALCRDLTAQGWLEATQDARQTGGYTKGRPALRYAFRSEATLVIGVDAGKHRISAAVSDLSGTELGRAQRLITEDGMVDDVLDESLVSAAQRRAEIIAAVDEALADAGVGPERIGGLVLGVPAPVDSEGVSPVGLNEFWGYMNPDLVSLIEDTEWEEEVRARLRGSVVIENDANLAALAEMSAAKTSASFAALLSGERFGAGIVLGGELLRQPRGGAGELGILDLVSGVESTFGLAVWARMHAQEAIRSGRAQGTALETVGAEAVRAEHVFAAAEQADDLALEIVDLLAERLARICTVLAGLLDLDRIVLTGATAAELSHVVASARRKVAAHLYAPWLQIETSELGTEAVMSGAVRHAVSQVRERALAGEPVFSS